MKSITKAAALVLFLSSAACVAEPLAVDSSRRAIVGGELDTTHGGVVMTYSESACSGVLIAPRLIALPSICLSPGVALQVLFGQNAIDAPDAVVTASAAVFHPDFDPDDMESPHLAVAILDEAPPASATPIPPLPSSLGLSAADVGSLVTPVGYGVTDITRSDVGVRRFTQTLVAEVCTPVDECLLTTPKRFVTENSSDGAPCSADSPVLIQR